MPAVYPRARSAGPAEALGALCSPARRLPPVRTVQRTRWQRLTGASPDNQNRPAASRVRFPALVYRVMGAAGFEPAKAEPPDLQSGPFVHFGTLPNFVSRF